MGVLVCLFHEVAESVQWERWEGTIEYSFMAPMRRLTYLGGVCLFAAAYGAIRTVIVMFAVVGIFDWILALLTLSPGLLCFFCRAYHLSG